MQYKLTGEQFDKLEFFSRMFESNAETLQDLCSSEKSDVVYGFELGKLHTYIRTHFIDFQEVLCEIKSEKINPQKGLSRFVKVSERIPNLSGMYICHIRVEDDGHIFNPVSYCQFDNTKGEWINSSSCGTLGETIDWLETIV